MIYKYNIFYPLIFFLIFFFNYTIDSSTNDPLCGPKSLQAISKHFKVSTTLEEICTLTDYTEQSGTTMLGLYEAANKLNLPAIPLKVDIDQLCRYKSPSIVFIDSNHFLVVHGCKWFKLKVQNPPGKPFYISKKEFLKRWNGEALVFSEKLKKQMAPHITQAMKPPVGAYIHFYETEYNFGVVKEGSTLLYKFKFINIGKDTLSVSARSTCSCTAAVLSDNNIPPEGSGEISVSYNTSGKKGFTSQSVDIRTNNPEKRWVKLTLLATVKSGVKARPDRLWIGEVSIKEIISHEILVIDSGDNTLEVESVEVPEDIIADILPVKDYSDGLRAIPIKLSINSGTVLGNFENQVTIHTNDPIRSEIIIPISGIVLGDLKALPPSIFFGEVGQDSKVIREITLTPTNGKKPEIPRATFSSPYISTEVTAIENSTKYRLVATLNSPSVDMTISDNIPIYINGNKDPAIEIPVYARVAGAQ